MSVGRQRRKHGKGSIFKTQIRGKEKYCAAYSVSNSQGKKIKIRGFGNTPEEAIARRENNLKKRGLQLEAEGIDHTTEDNKAPEEFQYRCKEDITKGEFIQACSTSKSLPELVSKLDLKPHKSVNDILKELSFRYQVSLPVWTTRKKKQNKRLGKYTDEERLRYGETHKGSILKPAMIRAGVPYVCSVTECPLHTSIDWCGKKITLQVDHVDGDRLNNYLSNLRFLCPNCHSQTPTYGSKKEFVDCSCGRRKLKQLKECPHTFISDS